LRAGAGAVTQVSSTLALTDVTLMRTAHMDAKQYFASPLRALAGSRQLIRYVVLDCEPTGPRQGRYQLADVQVPSSTLPVLFLA
jgi:nonsense-mediated mRNA decay protein 3